MNLRNMIGPEFPKECQFNLTIFWQLNNLLKPNLFRIPGKSLVGFVGLVVYSLPKNLLHLKEILQLVDNCTSGAVTFPQCRDYPCLRFTMGHKSCFTIRAEVNTTKFFWPELHLKVCQSL